MIMMVKRILPLIVCIFCVVIFPATWVQAQDDIPDNCENATGEYYQPNVFARFDRNNQRLTLVDWTSGEIVSILDENRADEMRIMQWSPNCRYLAVTYGVSAFAATPGDDGSIEDVYWSNCCLNGTLFYDVIERRYLGESGGSVTTIWSPNSDYALTSGRYSHDVFLWNTTNGTSVRLPAAPVSNIVIYIKSLGTISAVGCGWVGTAV
jgi:WD40 repeat protein